MRAVVRKYRSSEEFVVDVEEWECPACKAIREGGCDGDGILFLEHDGTLHRCTITSLVGRFSCVTCEVVSREDADAELSRVNWPNIYPEAEK